MPKRLSSSNRLENNNVVVAHFLTLGSDLVTRKNSPARVLHFGRAQRLERKLVVGFLEIGAAVPIDADEALRSDMNEAAHLTKQNVFSDSATDQVGRDFAVAAHDLEDCVFELERGVEALAGDSERMERIVC